MNFPIINKPKPSTSMINNTLKVMAAITICLGIFALWLRHEVNETIARDQAQTTYNFRPAGEGAE